MKPLERSRGFAVPRAGAWRLARFTTVWLPDCLWRPRATYSFLSEGNSVVCGVFMPGGTATVVEGGYRLTGTWDFASGCDHASHALLAAAIRPGPEEKPVGIGNMLLRRDEFLIEDNWHVAGLAGTGSRRVRVEDVFVAQEFSNSGPGVFFEEHAASESSKRGRRLQGAPGEFGSHTGSCGSADRNCARCTGVFPRAPRRQGEGRRPFGVRRIKWPRSCDWLSRLRRSMLSS